MIIVTVVREERPNQASLQQRGEAPRSAGALELLQEDRTARPTRKPEE